MAGHGDHPISRRATRASAARTATADAAAALLAALNDEISTFDTRVAPDRDHAAEAFALRRGRPARL